MNWCVIEGQCGHFIPKGMWNYRHLYEDTSCISNAQKFFYCEWVIVALWSLTYHNYTRL